jgi:pimeloyl-ACP methyl ester carboxylesterase
MKQGVVLLHGVLRTSRCMASLASFLKIQGYDILNIDYPSSKYDIATIANVIHPLIQEFAKQVDKLHFVGYSMGGLVIRAYLHKYNPGNLARVVMIATPNGGSEIADFLQNFWFYRKIYGPAGAQLITDQTSFREIFGHINYELGIISGISNFYIIASLIMDKESDGRVSVANTKIVGMKEQVTIKAGHTFIASNKKTLQFTSAFLLHGTFYNDSLYRKNIA